MLSKSDELATYRPKPGETLDEAIAGAIGLAKKAGTTVSLHFSEVPLQVDASSDPEKVRTAFFSTPPYVAPTMEQLMQQLPEAIAAGEAATLKWVLFAADHELPGRENADRILQALREAGYRSNDCIGDPAAKTDASVYAKWVVGQAMDELERTSAFPSAMGSQVGLFDKYENIVKHGHEDGLEGQRNKLDYPKVRPQRWGSPAADPAPEEQPWTKSLGARTGRAIDAS